MTHSIARLGRSLAPALLLVALAAPTVTAQGFAFGGFNNGFGQGGFQGGGFDQGGGFAYGFTTGNGGGFVGNGFNGNAFNGNAFGNRAFAPNVILNTPFSGFQPMTTNNLGFLGAAIDQRVANKANGGGAPIRRRRR